jgi:hypothetical protein
MRGLAKLNYTDSNGNIRRNYAKDIAYKFSYNANGTNGGQIITKYADYFTDAIVEVNNLAEDGYVTIANARLTALNSLSEELASMGSKQ